MVDGLEPLMSRGAGFGEALRAVREARGLSLDDVADATRVRAAYLAALEAMTLEKLPSRPFAIGYVRAYAQALGLDGQDAVDRFKAAAPSDDQSLRAPVGVHRQRDPRVTLAIGAAAIVVTAVVGWNLAQHALARTAPAAPAAPAASAAPLAQRQGPVALAAAKPAPPESDVPKPYVTPGLAPAGSTDGAAQAVPAVFSPKTVYGVSAQQSPVALQARKAASLIVRGADGTVYFARQLSAGEAYRAPVLVKGLVIDVSDPQAFDVFLNGEAKGPLPAAQTPVAKLAG